MKTIGYCVVAIDYGDPLELLTRSNSVWKNVPAEGVLLRGSPVATVFPDEPAAAAAIARTEEYFKAQGKPKAFDGMEVYTLKAPPSHA